MAILIDRNSRVMTQGITGKTGQFHTRMCRDYAFGKNCFVAGVNPKKGGEDFRGCAHFCYCQGGERGHRRNRFGDLRTAAVCSGCNRRGG